MTDRELVQSLKQCGGSNGNCRKCALYNSSPFTDCKYDLMLLAADRLEALLPPVKIGDTVWGIQTRSRWGKRIVSGPVSQLGYNDSMELCAAALYIGHGKIGETIFLTQEEAEKALQKIQEEIPWRD